MRKRLPALAMLAISPLLFAQQEMNNDAVIKLLKAGLSDDLIVTTIDASPGKYDTSADALTALSNAGADSKVISAVLMKSAPGPPPPPAAPISLPTLRRSPRRRPGICPPASTVLASTSRPGTKAGNLFCRSR